MKRFHHWLQVVGQLGQLPAQVANKAIKSSLVAATKTPALQNKRLDHRLKPNVAGVAPMNPPCRTIRRPRRIRHPRMFFAALLLTMTAFVGQRFYNQPELQVDTQAPETIVAPENATVVDDQTTEERRMAARNGVLRVLTISPTANEQTQRSLNNLLVQASSLRRQAGPATFVSVGTLSSAVQHYIRAIDDAEWQMLQSFLPNASLSISLGDTASPAIPLLRDSRFLSLTAVQRKVVQELMAYQQRATPAEVEQLKNQITLARQRYQQAHAALVEAAQQPLPVPNDSHLLDLSDREWVNTQTGIRKAADRMMAQGIMPGLQPQILTQAARAQVQGLVPKTAENWAVKALTTSLTPNLVEDSELTRQQAEMAAEAVQPVKVAVQAGDVIVVAGDTINQSEFVLLDHFNLSQRRFNWLGFIGFGILVGGSMGVFLVVERFFYSGNLRQRDYVLIATMVLGAAGLNVIGVGVYSLPAVGLLVGSFYGPLLGGTLVGLLTLVLPVGSSVSSVPLMASAAGAWVCSVMASRMRSREELALLGGGVGLTQGIVYLLLTLIFSAVSPSAWYSILTGAARQGIYGVISSIVALGLSPYLEHLFDLVTPIRLAELANPNRPLLKRLASEAPGTFQHTLFVASLAEAAARALGCNVELVRAGTLYHDIGKMHDPLGFIENQMGGPNKHDELNDPWLSAAIIKKHVTEGIVMARKCRLPKAIQAFIPEHQGTMLISYFHHQAQERAAADPAITVNPEDFRYDGPIPQSPETGIVMLADSCEAALRSLTDATPDEALAMVNRILRARWKDDQLVESGLTREHMSVIADIFVQVWLQYNHKRIAYPKAALAGRPSA